MAITKITNNSKKQTITRFILEALPDWFGIPEAREEYIEGSLDNIFFCAYDEDKPVGFLYIKETGKDTAELACFAGGILCMFKESLADAVAVVLF